MTAKSFYCILAAIYTYIHACLKCTDRLMVEISFHLCFKVLLRTCICRCRWFDSNIRTDHSLQSTYFALRVGSFTCFTYTSMLLKAVGSLQIVLPRLLVKIADFSLFLCNPYPINLRLVTHSSQPIPSA